MVEEVTPMELSSRSYPFRLCSALNAKVKLACAARSGHPNAWRVTVCTSITSSVKQLTVTSGDANLFAPLLVVSMKTPVLKEAQWQSRVEVEVEVGSKLTVLRSLQKRATSRIGLTWRL